MTDHWKAIAGFEGRYDVSRAGEVRNVKTGHILKPVKCSNAYLAVQLGRGNRKLMHRIIATAFVPGDTTLQVNHKNGTRSDNRVENLEWMTCSDNHRHSYAELNRKQHGLTQPVIVGGVRYASELAAAKAIGVVAGSVASALNKGHRCRGMEVSRG